MSDFTFNNNCYELLIRPWKRKGKYEAIKYPRGYRNLWERISLQEYKEAKRKRDG